MNARRIAYNVLTRVERDQAYSNLALMHELSRQRPAAEKERETQEADRRLATELVYGVLRHRRLLDVWIRHLSSRPDKSIDPVARQVLRLSLYQLLKLDRIPQHAVLNEAGSLLRQLQRGHAVGFVNALLRRCLRELKEERGPEFPPDAAGRLAIEHSIPNWLVQRLLQDPEIRCDDKKKQVGRLTERLERFNRPAPLSVCVNTTRMDVAKLIACIEEQGGEAQPGEWSADAVTVTRGGIGVLLPLLEQGLCHVADEASQLVARLLDAQPEERILDCCAAPGGKTLMAASAVGPDGSVLAVDLSEAKLKLLSEQAARHGFTHIQTFAADMSQPQPSLEAGSFDRVLVDAPCTALGVIRRHPEIRWRREAKDVRGMAALARTIAEHALRYVKPGGVLVFSVCTHTDEEGPQQLRHLQQLSGWNCERSDSIDAGLWNREENLCWFDTRRAPELDGFFAFRLRRPQQ